MMFMISQHHARLIDPTNRSTGTQSYMIMSPTLLTTCVNELCRKSLWLIIQNLYMYMQVCKIFFESSTSFTMSFLISSGVNIFDQHLPKFSVFQRGSRPDYSLLKLVSLCPCISFQVFKSSSVFASSYFQISLSLSNILLIPSFHGAKPLEVWPRDTFCISSTKFTEPKCLKNSI